VWHDGKTTTAELAIFDIRLRPGESGVWLNSRGTTSGVQGLVRSRPKTSGYQTVRVNLPPSVSETLRTLYRSSRLKKGCPDLLIWDASGKIVRLIEVKRRDWDRITTEQFRFMDSAKEHGIACETVEWVFS